MAFTTGTATDHADLLAKLVTFVTANGWTTLAWDGSTWVGKGSGDNGNDEIFVEFGLYENSSTDAYNLTIRGASGWRDGASNLDTSPVVQGGFASVALWSSAIPYWFIANGRRIIIIAQVGTKFFAGHAGLLRPFGTAEQEPYPLFIAGSYWSSTEPHTSINHSSFWYPSVVADRGLTVWPSHGAPFGFTTSGSSCELKLFPWSTDDWTSLMGEVFGGGHVLRPSIVHNVAGLSENATMFNFQTYGHVEGLYHIPGLGQTSSSTVTIGGDTYLIVQSAHHVDHTAFAAIKLA